MSRAGTAGVTLQAVQTELSEAKAIIVIWSESGVRSEWVCAAAAEAREMSRLAQAIVEGFPARYVPLPYHVFDLYLVTDFDGIVRGLEKMWRKGDAGTWLAAEKERGLPAEVAAPEMAVQIAPAPFPAAPLPPLESAKPSAAAVALDGSRVRDVAAFPVASPNAPGAAKAASSSRRGAMRSVDLPAAGRLVENIPRAMRAAVAERVEVRLSREETAELLAGFEGRGEQQTHGVMVTQAMSVMLRAKPGTFHINNLSPETQWVYDQPGVIGQKFGRWRWDVMPLKRGKYKLLLVVSARTARGDGVAGDVALPDQIIEVAVKANAARDLRRFGLWAAVAVAGGVLTEGVIWLVRALAG